MQSKDDELDGQNTSKSEDDDFDKNIKTICDYSSTSTI